jgi:uncharacterized protein (TIGR02611 family)
MSLWKKSGAPLIVKQARRLVIFVVGSTVVAIGIVMMVAPGPAFVVIPAGLAILATEFVWAKRLLDRVKRHAQDAYDMAKRMTVGESAPTASDTVSNTTEPLAVAEAPKPEDPEVSKTENRAS